MLAQVGALLKSEAPGNPLAGYKTGRSLFMSAQALDPVTYARAFQTLLRLPGDKAVYDGFLFKTQNGAMARLSHCGQPVPATDPRAALKDIGVPAIAVISPGEVLGSLASRRPDSDGKADPYRRIEVPAATISTTSPMRRASPAPSTS